MVQKKNITYPTDNKLHWKIINKCIVIADKEAIGIRQSYTRTLKRLLMDQRSGTILKIITIAGILVRKLERAL